MSASSNHVYKDITFVGNGTDEIQIGKVSSNDISNFSVSIVSGSQALFKWTNPSVVKGKPYTGVIINYSTSGYPGTGGTQIYKGVGNSSTAAGQSQVTLSLPSLNTLYYFSIISYTTINGSIIYGKTFNASCTTSGPITKTFTASASYTIPSGYTKMDSFLVGGGAGGGGTPGNNYGGGGGGAGYTITKNSINISSVKTLTITVGSGGNGGINGSNGGVSKISNGSTVLVTVNGGSGGKNINGGNGGSGGGAQDKYGAAGNAGGSNGSNGAASSATDIPKGQGTTTRAWGSSSGTLYAGGGGSGAGYDPNGNMLGGSGGSGGGGKGADSINREGSMSITPVAGTNNTGGGGGGARGLGNSITANGAKGGTGIILVKLY